MNVTQIKNHKFSFINNVVKTKSNESPLMKQLMLIRNSLAYGNHSLKEISFVLSKSLMEEILSNKNDKRFIKFLEDFESNNQFEEFGLAGRIFDTDIFISTELAHNQILGISSTKDYKQFFTHTSYINLDIEN